MRVFWEIAIEPLLGVLAPRRILEIGVDHGLTTEKLVAFAEAEGGVAIEAIDVEPKFDTDPWEHEHPGIIHFHRGLSLDVLPGLDPVDVALIDGDHNFYTVRHELALLDEAAGEGDPGPVVLLHDVEWPYGRRDLYYAPDNIPPEERNAFRRGGLVPGRDGVFPEGFNAHLHHATVEGGERNGVRTAIDDFVEQSAMDWHVTVLPGEHGLGILVAQPLVEDNRELRELLESFTQPAKLLTLVETIERERIMAESRRQRVSASGRAAAAAKAPSAEDRSAEVMDEAPPPPAPIGPSSAPESEPTGERAPAEEERQAHGRTEERLVETIRSLSEAQGLLSARSREIEILTHSLGELRDGAAQAREDARQARSTADEAESGARRLKLRVADMELRERELETSLDDARQAASDAIDARGKLERQLQELTVAHEEAGVQQGELTELRQQLARTRAVLDEAHDLRIALESQVSVLAAERDAAVVRATAASLAPEPAEPAEPPSVPAAPSSESTPTDLAVVPRDDSARAPEQAPRAAAALNDMSQPERIAYRSFLQEYPATHQAPGTPAIIDATALPAPTDRRGVLVEEHPSTSTTPAVDVIVCVHNALEDVRRCLWSILEKSDWPLRLVLVNDGSDEATTEYLRAAAGQERAIQLIENLSPPHGYTVAANLGLGAATGAYLILLNSDTIVTPRWIDRIVECGESDPAIGILGPLSNAASHQSLPETRDPSGWSTNPLPPFVHPDGVATLLERVSPRARPRFPFINGFCYVIKRAVVDAIGYFDEEHFASGYCEENDYSVRAAEAGFELAVVDDGYVFHAKSKSFTPEGRGVIAKRNYEIFLEKHGREKIQERVTDLEQSRALIPLRSVVADALSSDAAFAGTVELPQLQTVFILPGLGAGGSGGSHSVYQEVKGLRSFGLDARVALAAKAMPRARGAYDDADEVFEPFDDVEELGRVTADADVIVATHFKSVRLLAALRSRRDDFVPAYYIQDYEPFFTLRDSADSIEAVESYTLIDDCVRFAKTHWLCNIVATRHGGYVAKVEPSIDEGVYCPSEWAGDVDRVRIAAMIRPRTPRRQPTATLRVLEQLQATFGSRIEVTTFGCPQEELEQFTGDEALRAGHRGVLSRHEVAELLRRSDVFLDMSLYQAFGRTALEAMACGATAVLPRLGGAWEFLEHRGNGIAIDTTQWGQAFDAVSELIEDDALRRGLQARARQTGRGYSILCASMSEYLVFAREHARRFGLSDAVSA